MGVFVRVAETRDSWTHYAEVLVAPTDKGFVATAGTRYQAGELGIEGGVRWYGGPSSSLFAQLPNERAGFLALSTSF